MITRMFASALLWCFLSVSGLSARAESPQVGTEQAKEIARVAQIYGYSIDASYERREITCPSLHTGRLIEYQSLRGNGGVSKFTVVVFEGAASPDSVQVIPILLAGAVPFLPAERNPRTIEVLNRIAASAPVEKKEDFLSRGQCYLALIGEPVSSTHSAPPGESGQMPPPAERFLPGGNTEAIFPTAESANAYRIWTLLFSPKGSLLKVSSDRVPSASPRAVAASQSRPATPEVAALPMKQPSDDYASSAPPPSGTAHDLDGSETSARPAPATAKSAPSEEIPAAAIPGKPLVAGERTGPKVPGTSPLPTPPRRWTPDPPPPPSRFIPDPPVAETAH